MKRKETKEQRLERVKQYFDRKYDKLKDIEFKTIDKVNMTRHFYLPKIIMNKGLSKRELALYPVLCSFADFRESNWFQISIANLCKFSGMSTATVHKALAELESDTINYYDEDDPQHWDPIKVPTVQRKKESTGKRHYNLYKVEFYRGGQIEANKGNFFLFNSSLIETGIWAQLSIRAKALYMYFRAVAVYDPSFHEEWEEIINELSEINNNMFRERRFDAAVLNISEISGNLRINYEDVCKVIEELENHQLCERESEYCLVNLVPREPLF